MAVAESEPLVVDLDAVLADATDRLPGLRERRQTLALDALEDAAAAEQLLEVEGLLAAAERTLELSELARSERARRAREAAERAAGEARGAAAVRVAELGVELQAAGREVDLAFEAVCRAVQKWLALGELRDEQSRAAGSRPGANAYVLRALALDGAFRHGIRALPRGVLVLEGYSVPAAVRPLVDVNQARGCGEDGSE